MMTKQVFKRDQITWQIYILLSFYGFILNILGPLTPYLREEHNTNYATAGFHFSLFAVGMLIAGVFGEVVVRKLGTMRTVWFAALGMLPGILLILLAQEVWLSLAGALLSGLAGSLILTTVPGALAHKYGALQDTALTEINAYGSLTAVTAPLLVGGLAATFLGWRSALILPFVVLFVYGIVQSKSIKRGFSVQLKTQDPLDTSPTKLPLTYWWAWLGILLVVAIEFCMIYWSSDFLISSSGLPTNIAALSVAFFLSAMLISRWIGSRFIQQVDKRLVYNLILLLTAVGFLLFWLPETLWIKVTGLFLTGLGVGNLYPITLAFAIGTVGPRLTETASARASLASGSAILSLPLLLGFVADQSSLTTAYGLVLVLILFSFLVPTLTQRKKKE
jgi:fucose permease